MAQTFGMRGILAAAGGVALIAGAAFASSGGGGVSPDEALQKLMEGNRQYVEGKMTHEAKSDTASRAALATSQKPYAIILSCADSRVPPEIVFDKGLGELFVVRVAGNVADPVVLGSVEYAAEHLGAPLVMVLGHERCGAVTATVDAAGIRRGVPLVDSGIKLHTWIGTFPCSLCKLTE